jgi:hypothetical protein
MSVFVINNYFPFYLFFLSKTCSFFDFSTQNVFLLRLDNSKRVPPSTWQLKTCSFFDLTTQNLFLLRLDNANRVSPSTWQLKTCSFFDLTTQNVFFLRLDNSKHVLPSTWQFKIQNVAFLFYVFSRYRDSVQDGRSGFRSPVRVRFSLHLHVVSDVHQVPSLFLWAKAAEAWRSGPTPSTSEVYHLYSCNSNHLPVLPAANYVLNFILSFTLRFSQAQYFENWLFPS